ncbi:MAG: nucleoside deaminase [Pseudomonadota bacterium]
MPKENYNYHRSTLQPDKYINELNHEINNYCKENSLNTPEAKEQLISRLLRRTGTAAFQGASRLEGGPFGAMLVDFKTEDGIPKVVGFGTNHVVLNSDPSAHAEMIAIRDASERLKRTDLSDLTLITSCECCPMCLSAATGCKVDKIYFAATRKDAANVGFSDEDQYRLMTVGGIEQHAKKVEEKDKASTEAKLNGHNAVVIVNHNGQKYSYYGDYKKTNNSDPTDLPTVQAIKNACKGLAELHSKPVFHLPEDTILISHDMPHPMSLITADWARIGRVRGQEADKPEQDSPNKNTDNIIYINDKPETMQIRNEQGQTSHVEPEKVWKEIANPSAIHLSKNLGHAHTVAFKEWNRLINTGFMPRY